MLPNEPGAPESAVAFAALLVHPDGQATVPVTLSVDGDGLAVQRPEATEALPIGWASLEGLAADGQGVTPEGSVVQVLEVVAAPGVLTFLLPAPEISELLRAVRRWSRRWRRLRHPPRLTAGAALAGALEAAVAVADRMRGALTPAGRRAVLAVTGSVLVVTAMLVPLLGSGSAASGAGQVHELHAVTATFGEGDSGIGSLLFGHLLAGDAGAHPQRTIHLPPATAPPAPAPPSLADAPPLSPHEVFGFAPYWTLPQSGSFNVQGLTTLAYFAVDVNPDGTLDRSGSGWNGYESQALADLVTRAHAAGDRVVLTVDQFDQGALNQLTSSPTAPTTLANQLVTAIEAKNLDGVNLDFEGNGDGDQAGLTNLVTVVSNALHSVDPHWQVTMDTYASSAGDPLGFYNIAALAPHVDAFFVMAYQLNLNSPASTSSPLTSTMFSDLTSAEQYAAAVDPAKVIFGLPFYGYDWPTTNGTLTAAATGPAVPVSYAQAISDGPQYWDPVTDTAWTSFQVGNQWHEIFYEDSTSLYMTAQLAQWFQLGGVGIWALGMEGGDPSLLAALDGFTPPTKVELSGPPSTSQSPSTSTTTTTTVPRSTTTTTVPRGKGAPTTTTTTEPPTTTTTTTPGASPLTVGTWQGQQVTLTPVTAGPQGSPVLVGTLTDLQTDVPALSCLEGEQSLSVYSFVDDPADYVVITSEPTDCTSAVLTFPAPASSQAPGQVVTGGAPGP